MIHNDLKFLYITQISPIIKTSGNAGYSSKLNNWDFILDKNWFKHICCIKHKYVLSSYWHFTYLDIRKYLV